jgi:hypothetical protein
LHRIGDGALTIAKFKKEGWKEQEGFTNPASLAILNYGN